MMNVGTLKSGLNIKRQAPTNSESVRPEATNYDEFRKRTPGSDKLRRIQKAYARRRQTLTNFDKIRYINARKRRKATASRLNRRLTSKNPSSGVRRGVPNYRSVPQKYIGGVNYRHRKRYIARDALPVVFMRQPPAEPAACTQMNGLSRAESFLTILNQKIGAETPIP